jgi:hypothetical protein
MIPEVLLHDFDAFFRLEHMYMKQKCYRRMKIFYCSSPINIMIQNRTKHDYSVQYSPIVPA